MIRHVFKLAWQRKKANALLILELLVTFLVLFGLAGFGLHQLRMYRLPLGFEYSDTWTADISTGGRWDVTRDAITLQQVRAAVAQMPEVEAVHLLGDRPFDLGSGSNTNVAWQEREMLVESNESSDGLLEALGVKLLEGRWFGVQDEGQANMPVVINRALRDALGADTVLGIEFPEFRGLPYRIVGVFEEFRLDGEFGPVQPLLFYRFDPSSSEANSLTLLLKPGVTAQFEDELLGVLKGTAPDWDFFIRPWTTLRADHIREYTLPLLLAGILTGFLLILVGCGMLGVLWQNVIRRMPEMGLRRAVGATASAVRLQVVLELIAMACLALVLGFVIVVQLPLSGVWQILDWALFIPALITSTLVLLVSCALFALYPSYQATRRDPVEALRYE
jgi:putative ABC transport system permease protein